jgi:hypothetical protein
LINVGEFLSVGKKFEEGKTLGCNLFSSIIGDIELSIPVDSFWRIGDMGIATILEAGLVTGHTFGTGKSATGIVGGHSGAAELEMGLSTVTSKDSPLNCESASTTLLLISKFSRDIETFSSGLEAGQLSQVRIILDTELICLKGR